MEPGVSIGDESHVEKLSCVAECAKVPAKVMAGDIAGKRAKVLTVQGDRLDVNARNGVKVDGAKVVTADIEASNGVIHVVDKVLLPE